MQSVEARRKFNAAIDRPTLEAVGQCLRSVQSPIREPRQCAACIGGRGAAGRYQNAREQENEVKSAQLFCLRKLLSWHHGPGKLNLDQLPEGLSPGFQIQAPVRLPSVESRRSGDCRVLGGKLALVTLKTVQLILPITPK